MESMELNKSQLNSHVTQYNGLFISEIVNVIKDNVYWLGKLGITEADIKIDESISEIVKLKLNDPENKEIIDLILQYVISDHLLNWDEQIPLAQFTYSDFINTYEFAFYIFKCKTLYFCYYFETDTKTETLITKTPLSFCQDIIRKMYKEYRSLQYNLERMDATDDEDWEEMTESGQIRLEANWNYNL